MGEVLGKGRPFYDVFEEKEAKERALRKKPSRIKPKSVLRQRSKGLKMQAINKEPDPGGTETVKVEMGKKKETQVELPVDELIPPKPKVEVPVDESLPPEPEVEPPVDYGRLDIRIAKLQWAIQHPHTDEYYLTYTHLDSPHPVMIVSKLAKHFKLEDISDDKDALVLCNLKPQLVQGMRISRFLLCAVKGDQIEMVNAAEDVEHNAKVIAPGYPRNPDKPYMKPWKNIWETVSPDLRVNEHRQVVYKGTPVLVKGLKGEWGFITTSTLTDCPIQIV